MNLFMLPLVVLFYILFFVAAIVFYIAGMIINAILVVIKVVQALAEWILFDEEDEYER